MEQVKSGVSRRRRIAVALIGACIAASLMAVGGGLPAGAGEPSSCGRVSSNGASTHGSSYAIDVDVLGVPLVNELNAVSTEAFGPAGTDSASDVVVPINIPGVVSADIIGGTSQSDVTSSLAASTSTATIANLNLLSGAITATEISGQSFSQAKPGRAAVSELDSHISGLVINGTPIQNIDPSEVLIVRGLLGIKIAEVRVAQEHGESGLVGTDPVFRTASHEISMIEVTLVSQVGTLPPGTKIVVGHAQTDASIQARICPTSPARVAARAFTLQADGSFAGSPIAHALEGHVSIPASGGSKSATLSGTSVPGLAGIGVSTNTACGNTTDPAACALGAPAPAAVASSTAASIDLLGGIVKCDAVTTSAEAHADGVTRSLTLFADFVNCEVGGTLIPGTPAVDTVIVIPTGLVDVVVILNEQIRKSTGPGHVEGIVNAIHILVNGPLGLEAQIIVAQSAVSATAAT